MQNEDIGELLIGAIEIQDLLAAWPLSIKKKKKEYLASSSALTEITLSGKGSRTPLILV